MDTSHAIAELTWRVAAEERRRKHEQAIPHSRLKGLKYPASDTGHGQHSQERQQRHHQRRERRERDEPYEHDPGAAAIGERSSLGVDSAMILKWKNAFTRSAISRCVAPSWGDCCHRSISVVNTYRHDFPESLCGFPDHEIGRAHV